MKKLFTVFLLLFIGFFSIFFLIPLDKNTEVTKWTFYDRNGEILYSEKPFFATDEPLKKKIKKGIILIEDQHFYDHHGVSFAALARAKKQNMKSGKIISGASTITMQLAKLLFLETETHDYWYKIRQILYAWKLELKYSKDEILDLYLSHINLGTGTIGLPSACHRYFSKDCNILSIGELATLTGTIQNPSLFNPLTQIKNAEDRKNFILKTWKDRRFITREEYNFEKNTKIKIIPTVDGTIHAPHFIFWVRSQIERKIDTKGKTEINVYTTIDKLLYQKILHILQSEIKNHEKQNNAHNGSVIAIDNKKNEILSMVGSVNFFDKNIDGSVNISTAKRSTGSVLKPFLYALALENGHSPAEELIDEKTSFAAGEGRYAPNNFNVDEEYGRVRFREALTNSYNLAAVNLLQQIGVKNFLLFLNKIHLNIGTEANLGLAAILGAGEESLLNLTTAYTIFPNQGEYIKPKFITKITDENGNFLRPNLSPSRKKILNTESIDWITNALSDNKSRWKGFQRGNALEVDRPAAVKTGTSQEFKDNWVIGYSPQITLGVWVGNARGTPMHTSSGVEGAGPIWNKVFRLLHKNKAIKPFIYHSKRKEISICRRPYEQNNCTEKITEFLLPAEIDKLKISNPPPFSMIFPNDGDIFHRNTQLLLEARNIPDHKNLQFYLDGNKVSNHILSLQNGSHKIWAKSDNKITKTVMITVED